MKCFEKCDITTCIWFRDDGIKGPMICAIAGTLFFAGWWLIIDVEASYRNEKDFYWCNHFCGICGTISLVMVNIVSNSLVTGDVYRSDGLIGPRIARLWLFLGLVIGFGAVIASIWILIVYYFPYTDVRPVWPGIGLFLQNALILAASMLYKFGKTQEDII